MPVFWPSGAMLQRRALTPPRIALTRKKCYLMPMATFTLYDLEKRVQLRAATANAEESYTRKLLDRGVAHCAKKLGEEAVETALSAVTEDRERLTAETADLLYHLLVVLKARDVTLADVEKVLAERESMSGVEEKASRKGT
jgi:phosphoribosyl-ATP pyrophosphohydrolase